jgi:hypothetical protein
MLDYGQYFFNWDLHINKIGYGANLIDMFGNMLTINRLIADNFHTLIDEWRDLISSGKKLAWVYGVDKPQIRYIDGRWIFNFRDGAIQTAPTPYRQMIDNGDIGDYEFFYWSPEHECAEILIKQCQLLKKFYNTRAKDDFSLIPGHKPFRPGYGWEIDNMNLDFVRTIYPRLFQQGENFYTKKNPSFIFGNRDQWFFTSNHEKALLYRDMCQGMNSENYSHLRPWFNDNKTISSGIVGCISTNYIF